MNIDPNNYAIEYLKCKMNPLYFIEKYIKIPTAGGMMPIASDMWYSTNKYRLVIKTSHKFKKTIFLATRQTGKTTLQLAIILHRLNFFGSRVGWITLDKQRSLEAIQRLKSMHENLPLFLKSPLKKSTSERLTYMKFENGGHLISGYVSSATGPEQLFRGLTIENLFIDELAFIPHADLMMGSIGPSFSRASIEAKNANKPYGMNIFSTPNGANGLFYDLWINATDVSELLVNPNDKMCDELFDDQKCFDIINQPGRNGYVKIKLHWAELFDEAWYEEQKRTLNFDRRKISQEIDLVFLGSSNSVFDDDVFAKFKPVTKVYQKNLFNGKKINIFEDLDPNSYYIIGIDTAASSNEKSDYSAISIWDALHDYQVAEFEERIPVLKHYAQMIKDLVSFMLNDLYIPFNQIKLAIERNSFGLGVIEELIYDEDMGDLFYNIIYHSTVRGELVPGLQTTAASRPLLINNIIQKINENPECIKGEKTINELRTLVQKPNGKIEADKGFHDDLVMATAFAITVRKNLVKEGELNVDEKFAPKIPLSSVLGSSVIVQPGIQRKNIPEPSSNNNLIIEVIDSTNENRDFDYSKYKVF